MHDETTFGESLTRVLAYRERGRGRSLPVRAGLTLVGAILLLASVPLVVVLPELGVPAALVALRLLAVEVDWAAKAYAWIDWRFSQARRWYRRQPRAVRTGVVLALLALAAALVWLLLAV